MTKRFLMLLAASALSSVLGCAGQADKTYRGEPLARLHGRVEAASTAPTDAPPLAAALVWGQTAPNADAKVAIARPRLGTSVPVSGRFPAEFTLDLYEPPPEGALFTCFPGTPDAPETPGSMATATVRAIRQGASPSSGTPFDFFGQVREFLVVYVDADVPAGSACPGGALSKGYHLFKTIQVEAPPCENRPPDDPSCRGPWPYAEVPLATPLTLVVEALSQNATPPAPPTPAPGATGR